MKKITAMILTAFALFFAGCTPDEATVVAGANMAGNLALSTWFSIKEPDQNVKDMLKDVVTMVAEASATEGSYADAVMPAVTKLISENTKLTAAQKNLVSTGSVVIIGGLDSFLSSKPEVKKNVDLAVKVSGAFCKGCLTALELSASSVQVMCVKRAVELSK